MQSLAAQKNVAEIFVEREKISNTTTFAVHQFLGCSSPLLSLVALGNVVGYTSILLPQLKQEESLIKLNSSEESWIGEP